jgi:hypothetical protein
MSNLYRELSIDASNQISVHLAKRFQGQMDRNLVGSPLSVGHIFIHTNSFLTEDSPLSVGYIFIHTNSFLTENSPLSVEEDCPLKEMSWYV